MSHFKPFVLIPSYNTGSLLEATVKEVLASTLWPVCVVVDGSTDDSEKAIVDLAAKESRLVVLIKDENEGKGAAVRTGLLESGSSGFTHVLVMDADGQHPAKEINRFIKCAADHPEAMILGQPVFDSDVPWERLYGRKLSVWLVFCEVGGSAIGDPLYGFRVYPIKSLLAVMEKPGRSNRYDFDPEVAVRLNWRGVPALKVAAPVRYVSEELGGVSHFHYFRDNLRFVCLHARLLVQAPFRWLKRGAAQKELNTDE